jgi:hypothetical protein
MIRKCAQHALFVLAGMAPFAAFSDCNPQFTQFGENGFGNQFNRYAWSVAVFNDRLYIGVQNEHTGAEIWRTDGVGKQPVVRNGLTTSHNIGPRSMEVCLGKLWAGTDNVTDGAQLWNSANGTTWTPVLTGGNGIAPTTRSIRALHCTSMFNSTEYLYIGMQDSTTGGKVVRTKDGVNFQTIVARGFGLNGNSSIHAYAEFNGALYAGTLNNSSGQQVWRTFDGVHWENVVGPMSGTPGGFGHEDSAATTDMQAYNGNLYLGNINALGGFGVYATPDGVNWTKIGEDGFGIPGNDYAWQFIVYENALWLGTLNNKAFLNPGTFGAGLWRTFDGFGVWEEMVGSRNAVYLPWGFGDPDNMGVRTLIEYRGKLYIGTAQDPRPFVTRPGFELWVWPGEACPAP